MSLVSEPAADAERALPRVSRQTRLSAIGVAIGVAYFTRLLVALLASFPIVTIVSSSGILDFEAGDGKLFEPGGLYLLEVLLRERAALVEFVVPTAALLSLGALLGVPPEWLLLRALAGPLSSVPERASRALPRLGALALASWIGRGLLVLMTSALAMTARSFVVGARDERLALGATAVVVLLGLVAWGCLSLLHDLAAIEVAVRGAPPLAAIGRALEAARQHARALGFRYAGWSLASAALLVSGAAAAAGVDVSGGETAAAAAALLLHQLTLLAHAGLRAAWLWSALAATATRSGERRLLGRAQPDAFL